MMTSLRDTVKDYNDECMGDTAKMKKLNDGNFAIAITTPLMKSISCSLSE